MFWSKKKNQQEESEHWTKKSENADPKYTKIETGSVIMIDHTKKPDEDGFSHLYSRTYINVSDLSVNGAREVTAENVVRISSEAIVQQIEQITSSIVGTIGGNIPQEDIDAMKYNVAYFVFKKITKDTGINLEVFEYFEDDDLRDDEND